jgi:GAF domain-containing protein
MGPDCVGGNSVPLEVSVKSLRYGAMPPRLLVIAQDIRDGVVRRADYSPDEEANQLLARAGELLGSSLDYEATLLQICGIVVPLRADWAAIDVIDESKVFRRVAATHIDPLLEELLYDLDRRWPLHVRGSHLRGQAVATRQPVALYRVTEADLRRVARNEEHREMLRRLGMRSAIWVPLIARDRVLGVMSVGYGDQHRRYSTADLELMTELARRAGLSTTHSLPRRGPRRDTPGAVAALGQNALAGTAVDEPLTQAAQAMAR